MPPCRIPRPPALPAPPAPPADNAGIAAVPAAVNVQFQRTPGSLNEVLDFHTSAGIRLFTLGSEELMKDKKFDGTEVTIFEFINALASQATMMGWDTTILNIPINPGEEQVAIRDNCSTNLINQYGLIPIPAVRAHAMTYMNQGVRAAQDAAMLNMANRRSIDKIHLAILDNCKDQWHIDGHPNGPLAYTTLMNVCTSAVNLQVEAANHLFSRCFKHHEKL
jgi:hypothetical protein